MLDLGRLRTFLWYDKGFLGWFFTFLGGNACEDIGLNCDGVWCLDDLGEAAIIRSCTCKRKLDGAG